MIILKKKLTGLKLNLQQKIINHKIKKEGLTDDILTKQLQINKQRNEHNITDKSKRIYKEFVQ